MAAKRSGNLLHELFFRSSQNFPDNIAVTFSGEAIESVTYRELSEEVENLSTYFKKIFSKNEVVGVYSRDCLNMPAILLAVMNASAAFYPISTQLQPRKVLESISHRSIRYILVENGLLLQNILNLGARDNTSGITFNFMDEDLLHKVQYTMLKVASRNEPCVVNWSRDLAYVMQTSGTTGYPKAVFVPHSCIVPNIVHLSSLFGLISQDIVYLSSPYTFDPSIVQIFLAFNNGAELLLTSEATKRIPERLCQTLFDQQRVTVFQPTPSLLYYIGEDLVSAKLLSQDSTLSVLAIGGESCPSLSILRKWKHPESKAKLFNIYGITEVSSWATCHHITDDELNVAANQSGLSSACKLGDPLLQTELVVYDDDGGLVSGNGVGHLWIGGKDRQCLLEGETEENVPVMRDSGDIVQIIDGYMWYLGRSDNQIKRFGQRINLDYIEEIVRKYTDVTSCTLVVDSVSTFGTLLHLFVVPKLLKERTSEELEKYKTALLDRIREVLPKVSLPDQVHVVSKLPLTSHGKVDKREVLRNAVDRSSQYRDNQSVVEVLSEMWLGYLDHNHSLKQRKRSLKKPLRGHDPQNPYVETGDMFILQGGDSLLAVQLAEQIEKWIRQHCDHQVDLSMLFEMITNKTFGCLVSYVRKMLPRSELGSSYLTEFAVGPLPNGKRSPSPDLQPAAKMSKSDYDSTNKGKEICACFARRGSEEFSCSLCDTSGCLVSHHEVVSPHVQEISLRWSVFVEKCIDASPLVVPSCLTGEGTVFIGSHSYLFVSVSLSNGEVFWKTRLGGRIESSGCLSLCGQLIIVGCYDGKVYVLTRSNGKVTWTYQTRDVVKSSPCLDLKTGFIWIGSHDGYLYGLDVDRKECNLRVKCSEGSCFSSPAISYDPHHVYLGTLAGCFLCVDAVSGEIKWLKSFEKPIFSSPLVQDDKVFVTTVDGCLRCLNHRGDEVWEFRTNAPIFSSPLGNRTRQMVSVSGDVIVASHGQKVYRVSSEGKCKWSTLVDGPVYATPCYAFCNHGFAKPEKSSPQPRGYDNACVIIVTTKGTVCLLDASDGNILKTFSLPGEIFSSPVIVGEDIVIGCRNDYLYCLGLT